MPGSDSEFGNAFDEMVNSKQRKIYADKLNWTEDVIAGLLSNGIGRDEIVIDEHPGPRTVINVRGVPRYEWKLVLTANGEVVSHRAF